MLCLINPKVSRLLHRHKGRRTPDLPFPYLLQNKRSRDALRCRRFLILHTTRVWWWWWSSLPWLGLLSPTSPRGQSSPHPPKPEGQGPSASHPHRPPPMEHLPSSWWEAEHPSSTATKAAVRRRVMVIAGASRLVLLGLAMASNVLLPDHKASGVYTFSPDDLTSPLLTTFTR